MRANIALLVTSWIIGIISGALGAPFLFMLALGLGVLWQMVLRRTAHQLLVAMLLVFCLGYVHSSSAGHHEAFSCTPESTSTAKLIRTYALTSKDARYVFKRNDGCELLVYTSRFPVLVRGTEAEIVGKQDTVGSVFSSLPEYAQFLLDNGISLVVRNAQVNVIRPGSDTLDAFHIQTTSRIASLFREPDSSILTAMITGDQGMILPQIKDVYRKSGITHILSISGLHVSVIAIVLAFAVGLLNVSLPIRSILILIFLWLYIASAGSPPSGVRAGVFWTCYVLAYHVRALVGLLTVILLTLSILITSSPSLVRSVGFELSCTAVLGIGIALFFLKRVFIPSWAKGLVTLLAVSLGATVATAPLTLYYFGNISLVGLLTNAVVVPVMPLITYATLFALFLQGIFAPLALFFSFIVHVLLSWVLFVATVMASIPYGNFEGVSFPLWGVIFYYACLAGAIILLMKRFHIRWREWWV